VGNAFQNSHVATRGSNTWFLGVAQNSLVSRLQKLGAILNLSVETNRQLGYGSVLVVVVGRRQITTPLLRSSVAARASTSPVLVSVKTNRPGDPEAGWLGAPWGAPPA
jgi:hypothetical protein